MSVRTTSSDASFDLRLPKMMPTNTVDYIDSELEERDFVFLGEKIHILLEISPKSVIDGVLLSDWEWELFALKYENSVFNVETEFLSRKLHPFQTTSKYQRHTLFQELHPIAVHRNPDCLQQFMKDYISTKRQCIGRVLLADVAPIDFQYNICRITVTCIIPFGNYDEISSSSLEPRNLTELRVEEQLIRKEFSVISAISVTARCIHRVERTNVEFHIENSCSFPLEVSDIQPCIFTQAHVEPLAERGDARGEGFEFSLSTPSDKRRRRRKKLIGRIKRAGSEIEVESDSLEANKDSVAASETGDFSTPVEQIASQDPQEPINKVKEMKITRNVNTETDDERLFADSKSPDLFWHRLKGLTPVYLLPSEVQSAVLAVRNRKGDNATTHSFFDPMTPFLLRLQVHWRVSEIDLTLTSQYEITIKTEKQDDASDLQIMRNSRNLVEILIGVEIPRQVTPLRVFPVAIHVQNIGNHTKDLELLVLDSTSENSIHSYERSVQVGILRRGEERIVQLHGITTTTGVIRLTEISFFDKLTRRSYVMDGSCAVISFT